MQIEKRRSGKNKGHRMPNTNNNDIGYGRKNNNNNKHNSNNSKNNI